MSNNPTGWHLRKELNLSHILTALIILMGVLKFGYDMDKRVSMVEYDLTRVRSKVENNELHFKQDLRRIEGKIDRLLERQ